MQKTSFVFFLLNLPMINGVNSGALDLLHATNLANLNIDRDITQYGQPDISAVSNLPNTASWLARQSASNLKVAGARESASTSLAAFRYLPKQGWDEEAVFCSVADSPVEKTPADGRVFLPGNIVLRLPCQRTISLI